TDTATPGDYTLSLHDALPIWGRSMSVLADRLKSAAVDLQDLASVIGALERERDYYRDMAVRLMEMVDRQSLSYAEAVQVEEFERSEEHTSELQSRENLVCRLL